jgi:hypothetical protein
VGWRTTPTFDVDRIVSRSTSNPADRERRVLRGPPRQRARIVNTKTLRIVLAEQSKLNRSLGKFLATPLDQRVREGCTEDEDLRSAVPKVFVRPRCPTQLVAARRRA